MMMWWRLAYDFKDQSFSRGKWLILCYYSLVIHTHNCHWWLLRMQSEWFSHPGFSLVRLSIYLFTQRIPRGLPSIIFQSILFCLCGLRDRPDIPGNRPCKAFFHFWSIIYLFFHANKNNGCFRQKVIFHIIWIFFQFF